MYEVNTRQPNALHMACTFPTYIYRLTNLKVNKLTEFRFDVTFIVLTVKFIRWQTVSLFFQIENKTTAFDENRIYIYIYIKLCIEHAHICVRWKCRTQNKDHKRTDFYRLTYIVRIYHKTSDPTDSQER